MDLSLLAIGPGWGDELLRGFQTTVVIASLSVIMGTALGLGFALCLRSRAPGVSQAIGALALLLRSLPELLVIFFVYYGGAFALQAVLAPFGHDGFIPVSAIAAGVIALSAIHAAYASEVFLGAFAAVPSGAREAAQALGMRPRPAFWTVTLPLALRFALPGLLNLVIVTLKSTPLVSAIGLEDLIRAAGAAGQNTRQYLAFYIIALLVYLLIAGVATLGQIALERRIYRFMGPEGGR